MPTPRLPTPEEQLNRLYDDIEQAANDLSEIEAKAVQLAEASGRSFNADALAPLKQIKSQASAAKISLRSSFHDNAA